MAECCTPLPAGGYECDFVDSVPESLSCPICLLAFRDPHILDCCGAKYCEPCIGRVKAAGQPCPLCKQQFTSLVDRNDQRRVLNLKVRCSRKKDGCQWTGKLRHLSDHERDQCACMLVECRFHCGERVRRRQLAEHEQDKCPQRPMDVKLESFMRKMEAKLATEKDRHEKELTGVRKDHKSQIASLEEKMNRQMEKMNQQMEKNQLLMERKLARIEGEYARKLKKMERTTDSLTAEIAELKRSVTLKGKRSERKTIPHHPSLKKHPALRPSKATPSFSPHSSSAYNRKCKVFYPYNAQNPDELTVTEGEVLEVLQFEEETEQEGWWLVRSPGGKEGLVPDNFVELLPDKVTDEESDDKQDIDWVKFFLGTS